MRELRRVWQYRDLLWLFVATDLKLRYKGSALGFLWGLLNPLMQLAILAFVFTHLFARGAGGPDLNYPLFLLTGLIPWSFVSQSITRSTRAILDNRALLQKVALPYALFPLASACSSLINFLLSLPALVLLAWLLGAPLGWGTAYFLVGLAVLTLFLSGMAFLVAACNVFFRDVEHLVGILLSMAFYATPIFYAVEWIEPNAPRVAMILRWNPFTILIEGVRTPVLDAALPTLPMAALGGAIALGTFVVGLFVFMRVQPRMIYYV